MGVCQWRVSGGVSVESEWGCVSGGIWEEGGGQMCVLLQSRTLVLRLVVNKIGFVGNEEDFSLELDLLTDLSGNNTDEDFSNNRLSVLFTLGSQEDINVAV